MEYSFNCIPCHVSISKRRRRHTTSANLLLAAIASALRTRTTHARRNPWCSGSLTGWTPIASYALGKCSAVLASRVRKSPSTSCTNALLSRSRRPRWVRVPRRLRMIAVGTADNARPVITVRGRVRRARNRGRHRRPGRRRAKRNRRRSVGRRGVLRLVGFPTEQIRKTSTATTAKKKSYGYSSRRLLVSNASTVQSKVCRGHRGTELLFIVLHVIIAYPFVLPWVTFILTCASER